ncbi:MAG: DegV family protein [Peptoniphilaceae bacterium]|nr:DegV family protein [Peptoniphilaceae bacterium]MDY3738081.1 DegV family protein [Peptoniphilaceae bacterium]
MSFKIIVDSSYDMSRSFAKENNIDVIPIPVISKTNSEEYLDEETIFSDEFYKRMKEGEVFSTSAISEGIYLNVFEKYYKNNENATYFSLSSNLSITYNNAKNANEKLKEKYNRQNVFLIDSKMGSSAIGLLVLKILQKAKEDISFDEFSKYVYKIRENIELIFTVGDLEYLYRGGRLSKTSKVLGSLISIKPVLSVEDGKIFLKDKVRGNKKFISYVKNSIKKNWNENKKPPIMISVADSSEILDELVTELKSEFDLGDNDIILGQVHSVIGSHIGPGSITIFYEK